MRFHTAYPAAAPDGNTTPCFTETRGDYGANGTRSEVALGRNRLLSHDAAGRTVTVPMICGNIRGDLRAMQRDAKPGDLPRETAS